MDLLLNPEMVHYCLDKLFDFAYENTLRIYEQLPAAGGFSPMSPRTLAGRIAALFARG